MSQAIRRSTKSTNHSKAINETTSQVTLWASSQFCHKLMHRTNSLTVACCFQVHQASRKFWQQTSLLLLLLQGSSMTSSQLCLIKLQRGQNQVTRQMILVDLACHASHGCQLHHSMQHVWMQRCVALCCMRLLPIAAVTGSEFGAVISF